MKRGSCWRYLGKKILWCPRLTGNPKSRGIDQLLLAISSHLWRWWIRGPFSHQESHRFFRNGHRWAGYEIYRWLVKERLIHERIWGLWLTIIPVGSWWIPVGSWCLTLSKFPSMKTPVKGRGGPTNRPWKKIPSNTQTSGQNIIFHQPRFPWNKGISFTKPPFGGNRSCEVAIIWPETLAENFSPGSYCSKGGC